MQWQLQDAKNRFSELVQRVLDEGPQVVTRRGEEVVVVMSIEEYDRLRAPKSDFSQFLLSFPDVEPFEIERSTDPPREVDL
jgi:antitoxin Phd